MQSAKPDFKVGCRGDGSEMANLVDGSSLPLSDEDTRMNNQCEIVKGLHF